jgi:hypothetical protein
MTARCIVSCTRTKGSLFHKLSWLEWTSQNNKTTLVLRVPNATAPIIYRFAKISNNKP